MLSLLFNCLPIILWIILWWSFCSMTARSYRGNSTNRQSNTSWGRRTSVVMNWLKVRSHPIFWLLILIAHRLWWRICYPLIKLSMLLIDLFVSDLFSLLFTNPKKKKKLQQILKKKIYIYILVFQLYKLLCECSNKSVIYLLVHYSIQVDL